MCKWPVLLILIFLISMTINLLYILSWRLRRLLPLSLPPFGIVLGMIPLIFLPPSRTALGLRSCAPSAFFALQRAILFLSPQTHPEGVFYVRGGFPTSLSA